MTLPPAPWREDPDLGRLIAALEPARVVGGAVRDTLLGLPVSDLDVATVHAPEESRRRIVAAGYKAVPTGMAHGTVTAVLPTGPVEVTTLRRDVETDGRHAVVAFTDDWQADAARRDFTINALSADPIAGDIHDYFGGLDDLKQGHVRFIGEPLQRIAEDHLRILRFFRFHARFGEGTPDAAGLAACIARANDLMALSRERIAQELIKLLAVPDPAPTMRLMIEQGILTPVLPEIDLGGVERLERLVALDSAMPDPIRRLAALLPENPATAEQIAARLKLSNAQRKRLAIAVDTSLPLDARPLAYRFGLESARDRLLLVGKPEALRDLQDWQPPRLPLSGGVLIARGLPQGPVVAATMVNIERRWIEAGFPEQIDAIVAEEVAKVLQGGVTGPLIK